MQLLSFPADTLLDLAAHPAGPENLEPEEATPANEPWDSFAGK